MIQGNTGFNKRVPSAVCYEETSISPRSAFLYIRILSDKLMLEVEWSVNTLTT